MFSPSGYDGSVAGKRLGVFDPSGRLIGDLAAAAGRANADLEAIRSPDARTSHVAALLVAPAVASDLGPPPDGAAPRWIVGDGGNAARVAGAAASASATGVLLTPVSPEALGALGHADPVAPELDLARARSLVATSLVDLTGAAADTLRAVAEGFAAHDCIVWWKDGAQMTPTGSRPPPVENYRATIAAATSSVVSAEESASASDPSASSRRFPSSSRA